MHRRFENLELQVSLGETALKFCFVEQLFAFHSLGLVSGGESGIQTSHLPVPCLAFLAPTPFDLQSNSLLQISPVLPLPALSSSASCTPFAP